jgi:hypothetical protein
MGCSRSRRRRVGDHARHPVRCAGDRQQVSTRGREPRGLGARPALHGAGRRPGWPVSATKGAVAARRVDRQLTTEMDDTQQCRRRPLGSNRRKARYGGPAPKSMLAVVQVVADAWHGDQHYRGRGCSSTDAGVAGPPTARCQTPGPRPCQASDGRRGRRSQPGAKGAARTALGRPTTRESGRMGSGIGGGARFHERTHPWSPALGGSGDRWA